MVFSSILFIFQFLPCALILYYICPKKAKIFALLILSLVFYSWGEMRFFPIMIATVTVNYLCALGIARYRDNLKKKRWCLIASLVISLGFLLVFKYSNFFIENINAVFCATIPLLNLTLPLGISFYTFQTLSYTIDVYRGKVDAEKNYINVAAYVSLFPQLIAGPIVRYTDVQNEMRDRTITFEQLESGMEDFIIGLARKVLIANSVGALWAEVESIGFGTISTGLAWVGILAFSLQIYFDFSGYSQMAVGLGKMLGFNFPKNFDDPYTARSVSDFWRRWHITLGMWFREYVYFPLGGSRCSAWRNTLNLFIVWALTGFWHGASWNFVIWGLYFFALLVIEKSGFISVLNKHRIFSHFYMVFALLLGWTLFAITDFSMLFEYLSRMFVPTYFSANASTVGLEYYLRNYAVILAVGVFFSTALPTKLYAKFRKNTALRLVALTLLFFLCIAYLVDSTYNPFLYFRF
ncbi:MAG: MBOAT family O-acyltransferase [Oscillospiraceae bacterium]